MKVADDWHFPVSEPRIHHIVRQYVVSLQQILICHILKCLIVGCRYFHTSNITSYFSRQGSEASRSSLACNLGARPSSFLKSTSNTFWARLNKVIGETILENGSIQDSCASSIYAFVNLCTVYTSGVWIINVRGRFNVFVTILVFTSVIKCRKRSALKVCLPKIVHGLLRDLAVHQNISCKYWQPLKNVTGKNHSRKVCNVTVARVYVHHHTSLPLMTTQARVALTCFWSVSNWGWDFSQKFASLKAFCGFQHSSSRYRRIFLWLERLPCFSILEICLPLVLSQTISLKNQLSWFKQSWHGEHVYSPFEIDRNRNNLENKMDRGNRECHVVTGKMGGRALIEI